MRLVITMIEKMIMLCGGVSEAIECAAAVVGMICTTVALFQANQAIKVSNNQEVFNKRMDAYMTVKDIFESYKKVRNYMTIPTVEGIEGCSDLINHLRTANAFMDIYDKFDWNKTDVLHSYRTTLRQLETISESIDVIWRRDKFELVEDNDGKKKFDWTHPQHIRLSKAFLDKYTQTFRFLLKLVSDESAWEKTPNSNKLRLKMEYITRLSICLSELNSSFDLLNNGNMIDVFKDSVRL